MTFLVHLFFNNLYRNTFPHGGAAVRVRSLVKVFAKPLVSSGLEALVVLFALPALSVTAYVSVRYAQDPHP